MPELDAERVRAAAARWIYVPVDATEVTTDDYRLTHYPDYTSVQWSATGRPVAEVLEEVLAHAREAGRPSLRWWVDERTRPGDTEEQLHALGLRMVERLEVLALPVDTELPVPDDVRVVSVTDRAGLELAARIQAEVFDMSPLSDAHLDDLLRSVTPAGGRAAGAVLRRVRRRRAGRVRRRDGRRRRAAVLGRLGAPGATGGGVPTGPSSPAGSSTRGRPPPTSRWSRRSTTPRHRS